MTDKPDHEAARCRRCGARTDYIVPPDAHQPVCRACILEPEAPDHEAASKWAKMMLSQPLWGDTDDAGRLLYMVARCYLDAIAAKERAEAAAEEWHHIQAEAVVARQRATHDAECYKRERDEARAKLSDACTTMFDFLHAELPNCCCGHTPDFCDAHNYGGCHGHDARIFLRANWPRYSQEMASARLASTETVVEAALEDPDSSLTDTCLGALARADRMERERDEAECEREDLRAKLAEAREHITCLLGECSEGISEAIDARAFLASTETEPNK